jgi:hypothetical protein
MRTRLFAALPVVVIFLLLSLALPALSHADDWKPISPEELALKDNPDEPGAPAMILYRELEHNGEQGYRTEYVRIKIFTEAGRKYADVRSQSSVNPWESDPESTSNFALDEVKGRTIHPDGSIVPFTGSVMEKDETIEENVDWFFNPWETVTTTRRIKVFTLPDVTPGSIIEFKSRVRWNASTTWYSGLGWDVQQGLFQRQAHFKFIPSKIAAKAGAVPVWGYIPYGLRPDQTPVWQGHALVMDVTNIPAFVPESFMPPRDAVRARVQFFDSPREYSTPDEFWKRKNHKWTGEVEDFIKKSDVVQAESQKLFTASDTNDVKLRKIYDRVQKLRCLSYEHRKNQKAVENEHLAANSNASDVLTHGYGTHNELNRSFTAMARAAGFDAVMVIVVGRDRTIFRSNIASDDGLKTELVLVRTGGKELYLDPGTPFCPYGVLPWKDTGTGGLREDLNAPAFITTPVSNMADAGISRKAQLSIADDGTLTGTLEVTFTGQEALKERLRVRERHADEDSRNGHLKKLVRDWLAVESGVRLDGVNGWESGNDPLVATFRIKIPNYATKTGQHLMVPATVFTGAYANPFVSTRRSNSIYFEYPYVNSDDVTLTPASGLQIETPSAPADKKNNLAEFTKSATIENGALHLTRQFRLKAVFVDVKGYPAVKAFYDFMAEQDKGRATLTLAAK